MTTIPSQLPPIVTPPRSGALQALALQSGQTVDARIIGLAANGATQVEIRGHLLNLVLPVPVKAGETIKLEVQGAGQQMKLALQLATAPQASVTPAQQPAPASATPAVMQSAQPQATTQPAAVPPASTALPSAPATPVAAGAPAVVATPVGQTAAPSAPINPQSVAPLYPQAPGTPNTLAVAAAAVSVNQPASAAGSTAQSVTPVLAAAAVGSANGHALPSATTAPTPVTPSTPQAALSQMVHTAVPLQAPVTALTAALSSIAGKVVLPEPVARAAQQVLSGQVAIDAPKFNGTALQAAIRGSGVFQEANLAQGQAGLPGADMKTALLTLRQTLTAWLGQQAPVAGLAQVAPPLKGVVPRARGNEAPPIDVDAPPEEIGKHLLERTESALARTRLHQHASLPDPVGKTADWSMDLPVLIGQHQTLMQFQIHRDESHDSDGPTERGWQMRFAINLPNMGEVGAQVSLRAGTTGVMLWATEPEASEALEQEAPVLREALAAAGIRPGAIIVRHGEPHAAAPAPSGHLLDAST